MAGASSVRAAAAQLSPILENADGTAEKVVDTIAAAARDGVRFLVFPETFVPYYPYFSFVQPPASMGREHMRLYENAPTVPGPVVELVAQAARRHEMVVVLGVTERDHGSLYNAQLVFDATGALLLHRRKITPTFHERMVWGQGDGAGLAVVDSAVGRVGALACWEHYNPLARYALMAQHEEIHASQFPGSLVGPIFADQMEVTLRHHALESACFVVKRHRLADRRADRRHHPGRRPAAGAARRLLHRHRVAGGRAPGAAAAGGRGPAGRRPRHEPDRQAQADDGQRRPLRAARAAASGPARRADPDAAPRTLAGQEGPP